MPMRKKTLRSLPPQTRKIARLIGDLQSVARRLKNLLPVLEDMEMWQRAEKKRKEYYEKARQTD